MYNYLTHFYTLKSISTVSDVVNIIPIIVGSVIGVVLLILSITCTCIITIAVCIIICKRSHYKHSKDEMSNVSERTEKAIELNKID